MPDYDLRGITNGTEPVESLQSLVKTEADRREWTALARQHSREWMKFWIRLMHKHGYSNVEIAKRFGVTEGTIRHHIKNGL